MKQECIPVRCVPVACRPYVGFLLPEGVSTPGGCLLQGGVCPGGGGVSAPGRRVSQHALRQTPPL